MIIADRLRMVMAEKRVTQAELARRVGVSQQTIGKLITAQVQGSSHLHKIARELGTTPEYLTGETNDASHNSIQSPHTPYRAEPILEDAHSVSIPEVDISYSMGGGLAIQDHPIVKPISFPKEWLHSLIRGRFDQVFIAKAEGDSMQPTLLDGDLIIIDTAQQCINAQDRLWCLANGDFGMIKRVRALRSGSMEILSDNPAVTPWTAYDGEVHIVGRVIWVGRKM